MDVRAPKWPVDYVVKARAANRRHGVQPGEVGRVEASSTWLHLKGEPMSREVKGGEQWLPALPALETSFTCTCWLVRNFLHGALFSLRE